MADFILRTEHDYPVAYEADDFDHAIMLAMACDRTSFVTVQAVESGETLRLLAEIPS